MLQNLRHLSLAERIQLIEKLITEKANQNFNSKKTSVKLRLATKFN